jgi:hypothetical protein
MQSKMSNESTALGCVLLGDISIQQNEVAYYKILLIPQSTPLSPSCGSWAAGFSSALTGAVHSEGKARRPGRWHGLHNGHRCSGLPFGFTPFTLCQTTKTWWRRLACPSEALRDWKDLQHTFSFLSFPWESTTLKNFNLEGCSGLNLGKERLKKLKEPLTKACVRLGLEFVRNSYRLVGKE